MGVKRVLVFGCNALSVGVASQLVERGVSTTVISVDDTCLAGLAARGVDTVYADYTDDDELVRLGIGSDVDVIFSFCEDDAKNVFLTISARAIDPELKIISLTQSGDSVDKLVAAGANKVIDPYEISGHKIYDLIKRSLVAEAMEKIVFGQQHLNLAEIAIQENSFLDGQRLEELDLSEKYNLVLLGVVDRELGDEFIFCSSGVDHKLDKEDILVVIGPRKEIERLQSDAEIGVVQ